MSTSIPLPGQHREVALPSVDMDDVRARVEALLVEVDTLSAEQRSVVGSETPVTDDDQDGLRVLARQAQILERAHEVLVDALAAVDQS